jgi:hypothetical protein
LANFELERYLWPYLKNKKGKGTIARSRNAHKVSAQAFPSRSNMYGENSGKMHANVDLHGQQARTQQGNRCDIHKLQ